MRGAPPPRQTAGEPPPRRPPADRAANSEWSLLRWSASGGPAADQAGPSPTGTMTNATGPQLLPVELVFNPNLSVSSSIVAPLFLPLMGSPESRLFLFISDSNASSTFTTVFVVGGTRLSITKIKPDLSPDSCVKSSEMTNGSLVF